MKIGLLFGSFNPVHIGHLLLATRVREYAGLDAIWLVVSPHNPHKEEKDLADDAHRLEMAKLAVAHHPHIKVCDLEYALPRPSFTHLTLKKLEQDFPEDHFSIIIGEDLLEKLPTWKDSEWIQEHYPFIVYRRGSGTIVSGERLLSVLSLPLIDLSATEIRERIKNNLSIRYFVPENVEQYIVDHALYR